MSIYFLTRVDDIIMYDAYDSFIVEASSEEAARLLAADKCGDEGREMWLDPAKSHCRILAVSGVPGIILGSFNAG